MKATSGGKVISTFKGTTHYGEGFNVDRSLKELVET